MRYWNRIWKFGLFLVLLFPLGAVPATHGGNKIKKIVIFEDSVSDSERAQFINEWKQEGLRLVMDLPFMQSMIVRVPADLDEALLEDDTRVKSVEADQKIQAQLVQAAGDGGSGDGGSGDGGSGDGGSGDGGSGDGGSGDGGSGDGGSGDGGSGDGGSDADPPPPVSFIKPVAPVPWYERPWGLLDAFWVPYFAGQLTDYYDEFFLPSIIAQTMGNQLSNIRVAIFDTGVDYTHDRIAHTVAGGFDVIKMKNKIPMDDNGHGTHVAGTIAGEALGVAEGVQIYPVKVLDRNAEGEVSTLLMGFQWAIDNEIDIINLSVAYKTDNPAVRLAVQKTAEAGIIMVAAVGNHFNWEENGAAAIMQGSGDGGSGDGGSGDGGSGDGGSGDGGSGDGGSGDGGSGDGGSGDGGSGDGGSGDGGSSIQTCVVDPRGTLIDALAFTETFGGSYYDFKERSAIPGFHGAGYLYNPDGERTRNPTSLNQAKGYTLHFPVPGTYTIWMRGYATDYRSDTIFYGLDGTCLGVLKENKIYNQWVWSNVLQWGTSQFVINQPGEYTINIWSREGGHALDALFVSTNPAAVANGDTAVIPNSAVVVVDPSSYGACGATQPDPPKLFSVMYPAKYPEVIAVGAHDSNWEPATFANTGPEQDLSAPGVDIVSLNLGDGNFGLCSGTSMATPHVTGTVALMLVLDRDLSPRRAKDLLARSAFDGQLDVEYALRHTYNWRHYSDAQYFSAN